MSYCSVFKRYELKYLLTDEQYGKLRALSANYLQGDKYGESDILNLYYDTPDYLLIRRSLEKPFYKEKLRVRSYGAPRENGEVFVEIKKKYDSVVYKRRVVTSQNALPEIFGGRGNRSQIGKEIGYFIGFYPDLAPKMVISYRREAFFGIDDGSFRVTFDRDILWRDYDLALEKGSYGRRVLPEGKILMEVKTTAAIPLWLTRFLSANAVYKTSFSKYGNAYLQRLQEAQDKQKGGKKVA